MWRSITSVYQPIRNNSSPQGDGNLTVEHFNFIVGNETIHPRKGTETCKSATDANQRGKQFIPARGRKLVARLVAMTWVGNNSSPQGDGNTAGAEPSSHTRETIHPRKGTETAAYSVETASMMRNNSSPQGDGNPFITHASLHYLEKQFIPARGRKHKRLVKLRLVVKKQFIPARGRKHFPPFLITVANVKQFIPARGRKPPSLTTISPSQKETIHPRKGTETKRKSEVLQQLVETIHPRKGTETILSMPFLFLPPETIHPRKGTETHSAWARSRYTGNNSSPQGDGNSA